MPFFPKDIFCLFDDSLALEEEPKSFFFHTPATSIHADSYDTLISAFKKIKQAQEDGLFLCGYMSYEAGYFFQQAPKKSPWRPSNNSKQPLLYFTAFRKKEIWTQKQVQHFFQDKGGAYGFIHNLRFSLNKKNYLENIKKIKRHILKGDNYQVNYTFKAFFDLIGSPIALYQTLKAQQKVHYGAFCQFPNETILSFSPELFVRKKGDTLISRPMKGTVARCDNPDQDKIAQQFLSNDEKSRAENVMIVDLIRNDFSKIAKPNTVKVTELFTVETYKTLYQMVSQVEAHVKPELSFETIMKHLFPCGSITGAPKVETMHLIQELEKAPRGLYTGALGYILPNNDFCFNIPIRTLCFKNNHGLKNNKGVIGLGSGIVFDSNANDEYEECLLKGTFLTQAPLPFSIIETFRYNADKKNFVLLEKHLQRLKKTAAYFDIPLALPKLLKTLDSFSKTAPSTHHKMRILLQSNGEFTLESIALKTPDSRQQGVQISASLINSHSIFQAHKTTYKPLYDAARTTIIKSNLYDIIFLNEKGYVAEASFNNVIIQNGDDFFTPPLNDGALPGIYRAHLLDKWSHKLKEKHLTLKDLQQASQIYLCNSVRGLIRVTLFPPP